LWVKDPLLAVQLKGSKAMSSIPPITFNPCTPLPVTSQSALPIVPLNAQATQDTFETQYVQPQTQNAPIVSKSQLDIFGIALLVSSSIREAWDWNKFSIKAEIASLPKHL
jgi:hypothetical protein